MSSSIYQYRTATLTLIFGVFLMCLVSVGLAQPAAAANYAPNRAGGQAFASDFCGQGGDNSYGFGDYMWLEGPSTGNNTIVAYQGDDYAPVRVHVTGEYCSLYGSSNPGADYVVSPGSVSGRFYYDNGGPGDEFDDYQTPSLYIRGWQAGKRTVCITLRSFADGLSYEPSPPTCMEINLILIQKWNIRGESYVRNTTANTGNKQGNPAVYASPGDILDWTHDLRNEGPNYMDKDVKYSIDRTGFGNGWDGNEGIPSGNDGYGAKPYPDPSSLFLTVTPWVNNRTSYIVKPSDAGRTMCQRIGWEPGAWNKASRSTSLVWACANVPYSYSLTPSVAGPNGVTTVGAPITQVIPTVNNTLPPPYQQSHTTDSRPTEWQLKRIEVAPGGSIPMTQQESSSNPCAHYGNNCIDKESGTRVFTPGNTTAPPLPALNNETVDGDTPVGTRICYTMSVRPFQQIAYQALDNRWRHSVPVCVTVSKQPKVQVWGGDLRTRGDIETGTTTVNDAGTNKLFGSWVEYGGFSVGANSRFASGSGLNNGSTDLASAASWHKLTFANVNSAGGSSYGAFTLPSNLPPLADQFLATASSGAPSSDLSGLASGMYSTTAANFTITGGTIGQTGNQGKMIVVVSTGTITIDGNVVYQGNGGSDTFNSIDQLPQVVIIARNINITNAATQIDAWLLTTNDGSINTCSDRPLNAPLNSTVCNNLLTVNGPVVTSHLHLRRTAGSEDAARAGNPAEIFNLRADTLLWSYAHSSQSDKAQTVFSKELPPRF